MKKLIKVLLQLCGIMLFVAPPAVAQISITQSDLLGLIGTSQEIQFDTTGNMAINVGSEGSNQNWDFRSVSMQGTSATRYFLQPSNTPFDSYFPTANFAYNFLEFSDDAGGLITFYEYFEVNGSSFRSLGTAGSIPALDSTIVEISKDAPVPLPFTAQTSWVEVSSDTFGDPATFAFINKDSSVIRVDAWGTVQVPAGTFNCLRIRSDDYSVQQTLQVGMVISTTSTQSIEYTWLSRDQFIVAQAESQEDVADPNFQVAGGFAMLASVVSSVEQTPSEVPADFALEQNYPNPFNPETSISFRIAEAGQAQLSIFNVRGQKVRTLADGYFTAGMHTLRWDGRDDLGRSVASGVFLYQLQVGAELTSKKMLMLQ